MVARNRKPLIAPISWCRAATWQQRVEGYRVPFEDALAEKHRHLDTSAA